MHDKTLICITDWERGHELGKLLYMAKGQELIFFLMTLPNQADYQFELGSTYRVNIDECYLSNSINAVGTDHK